MAARAPAVYPEAPRRRPPPGSRGRPRPQPAGKPSLAGRKNAVARPRSKSAARLRYRPEGFVFAAVILCAVAGFIFSLVLLNIYLAQSSFRLAELEKSIAEQEALARRMRYQVAAAESPGRLAEASLRMGLVAPDRLEYVSAAGPSPARPAEGSSTLEKLAASRAAMRRGGAA